MTWSGAHVLKEGSTIQGALQRDNPRSILEEANISEASGSIRACPQHFSPGKAMGCESPLGSLYMCACVKVRKHDMSEGGRGYEYRFVNLYLCKDV